MRRYRPSRSPLFLDQLALLDEDFEMGFGKKRNPINLFLGGGKTKTKTENEMKKNYSNPNGNPRDSNPGPLAPDAATLPLSHGARLTIIALKRTNRALTSNLDGNIILSILQCFTVTLEKFISLHLKCRMMAPRRQITSQHNTARECVH